MRAPPDFQRILQARQRMASHLTPTPLRSYPSLDEALGLHVLVKHENHQPTNSFKIRNGLAAMTALPPEVIRRGVIAATRGNHGAAIAWAGLLLQVPVTICVPVGNNPDKNQAMLGFGAELIEQGDTYDDSVAVMERLARERGLHPIHSTNDPDVLAGAATLSLEILEQAEAMGERIGAMILAVGGGSQAAGAITVTRRLCPEIAVYGVQAEAASAIHDSWRCGRPLTRPTASTFADGIATRATYELTFETMRGGLTDFVLVSEAQIADALRLLIRTTHNLAEGAAAAGLAGLRKLARRLDGQTAVIVLSGANIDQQTLSRVLSGQI